MRLGFIIGIVLVGVAAAGWWLYDRSWLLSDVSGRHASPAAIADTVTGYSRTQLEEMGKAEIDMRFDKFEDKTFVPPSVSYVRVEYLASRVDKPFPKIYVADGLFPADAPMLESVLTVTPKAMRLTLLRASNLPCQPDSANMKAGADRFEVLLRPSRGQLRRCLIPKETGCRFIDALRRQTAGEVIGDASLPLSEMDSLQRRISCPTASLLPW